MDTEKEKSILRIAAAVMAAIIIILIIALALQSRVERVRVLTISKTEFVKKNVYIYRTYDPATGNIKTETITDKTTTDTAEKSKEKETEKPVNKAFYAQAGYIPTEGTWTAGGGMIFLNTFFIGIENPVALKFQPRIIAGAMF